MQALGITATDTDAGKTIVSGALASAFYIRGIKTGVYKPCASGCIKRDNGTLLSTDADFLLHSCGLEDKDHDKVVSYVLEPALAPAEASKIENVHLDTAVMVKNGREMIKTHEMTVVEGVGGISAPLIEDYLAKDFFKDLSLPIIIVVQPVLGNVNHAVLTAEYAKNHGLKVLGFIVNNWDENKAGILEKSNLYYYEKLTKLPVLGKLPKLSKDLVTGRHPKELAKVVEENIEIDKIIKLLGGIVHE